MERAIALGALVSTLAGCAVSSPAPAGPRTALATPRVRIDPQAAADAPAAGDAWVVAIAPYFWASSLSGDVQVKNLPETDFSAGFDDLVDDLQLGVMVGAEARPPGRNWSLLVDAMYMKLEDELGRGEVELSQWTVEGDIAWRPFEKRKIDVLAGARFWEFETEVELNALGSRTEDQSWVDPVVGARAFVDLGERWMLHGRADIGGFGVGSELTYQLLGTVRFELFKGASAALGDRWMHVDYDENDLDVSVDYYGPLLGLVVAF